MPTDAATRRAGRGKGSQGGVARACAREEDTGRNEGGGEEECE